MKTNTPAPASPEVTKIAREVAVNFIANRPDNVSRQIDWLEGLIESAITRALSGQHVEKEGGVALEDLRKTLDELCERNGYKGGLSQYMEYRTSRVIQFATDTWGNRDKTHLELRLLNKTLQVNVEKDHIAFNGFFEVKQTAINAFELRCLTFAPSGNETSQANTLPKEDTERMKSHFLVEGTVERIAEHSWA